MVYLLVTPVNETWEDPRQGDFADFAPSFRRLQTPCESFYAPVSDIMELDEQAQRAIIAS